MSTLSVNHSFPLRIRLDAVADENWKMGGENTEDEGAINIKWNRWRPSSSAAPSLCHQSYCGCFSSVFIDLVWHKQFAL